MRRTRDRVDRAPAPRGRPRIHKEAWTRVSVVLFERQVGYLDRLTASLSKRSKRVPPTRAEVIRALIDGLYRSRTDLSIVSSAEDLQRLLVDRLRPNGRRTS